MEPRRAPPGLVLLGPFWTRRRVQRHLHRPADGVTSDLALLRLTSPIGLGEVYPAFQFDDDGVRPDAAMLNLLLHRRVDDLRACDWYAEALPRLGHLSPLDWLLLGGEYEQLLDVLPEPVPYQDTDNDPLHIVIGPKMNPNSKAVMKAPPARNVI